MAPHAASPARRFDVDPAQRRTVVGFTIFFHVAGMYAPSFAGLGHGLIPTVTVELVLVPASRRLRSQRAPSTSMPSASVAFHAGLALPGGRATHTLG